MLINRAKFEDADYRFNTRFNKVFTELREKLDMSNLVLDVSSSGRSERYVWANAFPQIREWVSDAQFNRLQGYGFTLENKFFQGGIEVLREDLEDDQLGVVRPQIDTLAEAFACHQQDLIYDLLVGGFAATKGLSYDGQYFFDTDHKDGNGPSQSNKGTAAFDETSLTAAVVAMRSLKGEDGRVLRMNPTTLIVGPALEIPARKLIDAEYLASGATNVMRAIVNVVVWNRLAEHPTYWFLLDNSKGLKPFVFQTREPVTFAAQDRPTDEQNFMRRMLRWSAWARYNAGYAMWQMAFGSTGGA